MLRVQLDSRSPEKPPPIFDARARAAAFPLAVVNPGGNDSDQNFADFAGAPDEKNAQRHPPVNYHAYAACAGGDFFRDIKPLIEQPRAVILILRRDLKTCWTTLNKLKSAGCAVAASIKESGLHQIAQLFERAENLSLFQKICAAADGCISSTPELVPIYKAAGAKRAEFIPTPYPVDDPRWDFSLRASPDDSAPEKNASGIFIGTREFDVPSRNHAAALLLAREIAKNAGAEKVTVVNTDGRAGRKRLDALLRENDFQNLEIVDGAMPYPRYLRLIARHKIVFQLDRSAVPGQVAGDALLCRVPCVGGDSAIEQLAFCETNSRGRDFAELAQIAVDLLRDENFRVRVNAAAQQRARESVSFEKIADRLRAFFAELSEPNAAA